MDSEMTLLDLLEQRRFPVAALALVAEINESTAWAIVKGRSRPRGTTTVRMAEGLGIGYGRMRRILAATWETGHAALVADTSPAHPVPEDATR